MERKIEIPKKEQKDEYKYGDDFITYIDGIAAGRYHPYTYMRHTHTEVVQEEGMKNPTKITYGWTRQGVIFTYRKSKYIRYAIFWKPFRVGDINFSGYRFIDTTCSKYGGYHSDCAIDTVDEQLKNVGLNALTPARIHFGRNLIFTDIRRIKEYGIDPYEAREKDRIQLRKEIEIKNAEESVKGKRKSKEESEEYERMKGERETDKLVSGPLGVCMRKFQDKFNLYDSRGILKDRVKIVKSYYSPGSYGHDGEGGYADTEDGKIVKSLSLMEDGGIEFCKDHFKDNLIKAEPKLGTEDLFALTPKEVEEFEKRRKENASRIEEEREKERMKAKQKIQDQIAALQKQLNSTGGRRTRSKGKAKRRSTRSRRFSQK